MNDDLQRLDEQLSMFLDGDLEPEAAEALQRRIDSDARVRERYAQLVEMHALLHWSRGRGVGAPAVEGRKPTDVRGRTWTILAAAASVVALLSWWLLDTSEPVVQDPIATVSRIPAARFAKDLEVERGERLVQGREIDLVEGLAELTFDGGGRLLLQAPARLVLLTATMALLHRGRLTVVREGEGEFVVRTPSASVTDLGTEFGVAVDGETLRSDVHVFQGRVRVATSKENQKVELTTNQSAVATRDGAIRRDLDVRYQDFVRSLPLAKNAVREIGVHPPHAWYAGDGDWHDADLWRARAVPDRAASVRISRNAIVTTKRDAAAGEVFVGYGTWRIEAGETVVEGLQGLVDLGHFRPDSRLELHGGSLRIGGRLVLRSTATARIRGELSVGKELFFVGGRARLELGDSRAGPVKVGGLYGLSPSDRVTFRIDARGARRLQIAGVAALGGSLSLQFDGVPPRRDLVLIEVRGSSASFGRFDLEEGAIVHRFADGSQLRLTYEYSVDGATRNDVALVFIRN